MAINLQRVNALCESSWCTEAMDFCLLENVGAGVELNAHRKVVSQLFHHEWGQRLPRFIWSFNSRGDKEKRMNNRIWLKMNNVRPKDHKTSQAMTSLSCGQRVRTTLGWVIWWYTDDAIASSLTMYCKYYTTFGHYTAEFKSIKVKIIIISWRKPFVYEKRGNWGLTDPLMIKASSQPRK